MEHVARAVVVRDGSVLLMREIASGYWFFPGGHLEDGETPVEALVRELREELDVAATVTVDLGRVENRWAHEGVANHETNHVFAVAVDTDDPVSQEAPLAAGWIRVGDLETTDVRPRVLVDLVLAQARRR